ncbi:MAG: hypothetical protein ABSG46_08340 [Candidatus Binataceae bacterium]|jgi:hypothetical protein
MTLQNVTEMFADDSEATKWIKRRPLTAVALAASAGFIWGGGASGRLGRAFLVYVAQSVVRETVATALSDAVAGNGRKSHKNRD